MSTCDELSGSVSFSAPPSCPKREDARIEAHEAAREKEDDEDQQESVDEKMRLFEIRLE